MEELKRTTSELRAQNQVLVKALRDIHTVLLTLSSQGAEQKTEIYELRKRLTDFHEDTAGRYLMASGQELGEGGDGLDSSSVEYSSSVVGSEGEEEEAESVCGQPIEASRRSSAPGKRA